MNFKKWIVILVGLCCLSPVWGMVKLQDEQLAQVTGQALFMMDNQTGTGVSSGIDFYKVGLDAALEINMNIQKLQLGCGGVNGPGCDIDIDNLSLSGNCDTNRAACSALLTRPFVEFAIKNDDMPALREVVGFRLSAENAAGLLTAGDQQPGASDPGNTSGINSLSGYMKLGPTSGTAQTQARSMTYQDIQRRLTGRIYLDIWPVSDVYNFASSEYNLNLAATDAYVTVPTTVVSGSRMSSVNLMGSAVIAAIPLSGNLSATISGLPVIGSLTLSKSVSGSVSGLTAQVPIEQSLKFIHKINVNSPFSLSMQREAVQWPGAAVAAQTGWWMAFEDEVDIGEISPEDTVPIPNSVLLEAIGPENPSWTPNPYPSSSAPPPPCTSGPSINCTLTTGISTRTYTEGNVSYRHVYGVECNGLSGCLSGNLPLGNLSVPAELTFPLNNLKLGGQSVTPNCYGSARFC